MALPGFRHSLRFQGDQREALVICSWKSAAAKPDIEWWLGRLVAGVYSATRFRNEILVADSNCVAFGMGLRCRVCPSVSAVRNSSYRTRPLAQSSKSLKLATTWAYQSAAWMAQVVSQEQAASLERVVWPVVFLEAYREPEADRTDTHRDHRHLFPFLFLFSSRPARFQAR
jgi:hypothetical protein